TVQQVEALAAAQAGLQLAVGWQLLAVALQQDLELVVLPVHTEDEVLGRRFLDALDERILDEPEDRDLIIGGEPTASSGAGEVDADPVLVDEGLNVPAHR